MRYIWNYLGICFYVGNGAFRTLTIVENNVRYDCQGAKSTIANVLKQLQKILHFYPNYQHIIYLFGFALPIFHRIFDNLMLRFHVICLDIE